MIIRNSIPLFFLLTFFACDTENSANNLSQKDDLQVSPEMAIQDSLWKEVMVIHDEVMPKMSDINKISRALKTALEETQGLDEQTKGKIKETVAALTVADEAMWEWMHNLKQLKPLRSTMDHGEILQYLDNEKDAIVRVRDQMLTSINEGSTLLAELENVD